MEYSHPTGHFAWYTDYPPTRRAASRSSASGPAGALFRREHDADRMALDARDNRPVNRHPELPALSQPVSLRGEIRGYLRP